ncbi:DUF2971 domain-containing protein [Vibrio alginolyticus]|uniref:DUF2971 domain-containing protein n=1 Tax=Vibrio alginolyticus TaxID=663 RepID=UPI0037552258
MFQYLTEHQRYLYHYTSADKAINYILEDRTLMFNSLRGTNDPKESKNWEFDFYIEKEQRPTHDESMRLWQEISDEIKTKCKVLCFTKDMPEIGRDPLNDIYLRGFAKPRMWAQYGDNHRGVCLIFDKSRIEKLLIEQFDSHADLYGSDIKYVNRMIKGDIFKSPYTLNYPLFKDIGLFDFVRGHVNHFNNELIFEKSLDWRDENEYRYLMHIDSLDNQFLKFGNALKGIVFGTDTSEEDQRTIFQMTVKAGTQYEQIHYSNSTPWFSFKDFRDYHK